MSSIVVAIGLATLALWVAGSAAHKKLPVWSRIAISGSTLGAAVSLTHYIGMKAAVFVGYPSSPDPIAPEGIAPMVFAITLGVLVAAVNILGMNLFFKYRELARLNSQKNQEQQVLMFRNVPYAVCPFIITTNWKYFTRKHYKTILRGVLFSTGEH